MDSSDTVRAFCGEVHKPLEALVHSFCDEAYTAIMESVQDHLVENAEFNIGQLIAAADRELALLRSAVGRVREVLQRPSVPTMDPVWSAGFNSALGMVDRALREPDAGESGK